MPGGRRHESGSELAILCPLGVPREECGAAVQDLSVLLGVHNVRVVQGELLRSTTKLSAKCRPSNSCTVSPASPFQTVPAACPWMQASAGHA